MEENKIKIKFEFTNEFGSTYVQESSFDSMPEYESDIDKMGKLFNIFLKQIGYYRENDYMFMESLSEDELEAVDDFLYEYRETFGKVGPYKTIHVCIAKPKNSEYCGVYVDGSLEAEGQYASCMNVLRVLYDRTNILIKEFLVSNEHADAFPILFEELKVIDEDEV